LSPAIGKLTGGIAHDFNNLLTGIVGNLDLMRSRLAEGRVKELDRYIIAALGAAERAAALTHRLLSFARQQTLDPKPTNLNSLVAPMEELDRRTVGPEIAVEVVGGLGCGMPASTTTSSRMRCSTCVSMLGTRCPTAAG
jgi:signal transduction histidine kinase